MPRLARMLLCSVLLAACEGGSPTDTPLLYEGGDAALSTPSGFSITNVTATEISLAWNDNSNDETHFVIQRADIGAAGLVGSGASAVVWVDVASPAAGSTTYTNTGLTSTFTYRYKIRACNGETCTTASGVVEATTLAPSEPPAKPTALNVTATTSTSISLAWSDASNNETHFELQRAPIGAAAVAVAGGGEEASALSWEVVASPGANATSYTDTGLSSSYTYRYKLRACNGAGCSTASNVVEASTDAAAEVPPAKPTGLNATATTSTSVSLAWTDASNNETHFELQRAPIGAAALAVAAEGGDMASALAWEVVASPGANATSYTDTGLASSYTYRYKLNACNGSGCSTASNIIEVSTEAAAEVPPAKPTGLNVTATTSTSISLAWTDASNNETHFELQRAPIGAAALAVAAGGGDMASALAWEVVASPDADATSYTDTGLASSYTYRYKLNACNGSGCSTASNIVEASTAGATPPAAPSGVSATATNAWEVALSWADNSGDETRFEILRAESAAFYGGPAVLSFTQIAEVGPNTTAYTDTDVDQGVGYEYTVRACADSCSDDATADGATPPTTAFNIELEFMTSIDTEAKLFFRAAERRWEEVITADLPDYGFDLPEGCGNPAVSGGVDDMVIFVYVEAIDGAGGTLGSAGPCWLLDTDPDPVDELLRTLTGKIRFDEVDVDGLVASELFDEVALHEMGHVLGIGTYWADDSFLENPSLPACTGMSTACGDPTYSGVGGMDGYEDLGAAPGTEVPVANTGGGGTRDAHWREATFDNEVMTGYLNGGETNPLSAMTIMQLDDLGYTVDLGQADPYSLPSALRAPGPPKFLIPMPGDVLDFGRHVVDSMGRVIQRGR